MQINISKLLNGDIHQANHTTRYSTYTVHRIEMVSSHVYNTMSYAAVISYHLRYAGHPVDVGLVLQKALWHDLEEPSGVGDLLRRVKHSSPELRKLIHEMGHREVARVQEELGLKGELILAWELAKNSTLEGQIVRVADGLSVVAYLIEEYHMGNRTMGEVHDDVMVYLQQMADELTNQDLQGLVMDVYTYFRTAVNYHKRVL